MPGGISQLTDHPGNDGFSGAPAIDGAGTRVVFESSGDPVGTNADGNDELYLLDTNGAAGTSPLTDTTGGSPIMAPSLSADGTRIAFVSDRDLTGDNADGSDELYLGYCGRATPSFTDYPVGSTYFEKVEWMTAAGVASGFPDQTFRPQDFVKRQQMANLLYNLAGQPAFTPPTAGNETFTDYPVGSTYYLQVEWMAAADMASGFPDQTFRPQDFVKRQQMANFLHNVAIGPGVEAGVA